MSAELYKLTTFVLFIILIVLCYDGYKKYRSNPIGTSVKFEKNTGLQDFTICPWYYNKDLQIADITSGSGHSVEDVMNTLPSIKSVIPAIIMGKFRDSNKDTGSFTTLYDLRNSTNKLDQSAWVESIKVNEIQPYNLLRCATIQWPNEIQLQKNSYVSLKHTIFVTQWYYSLFSILFLLQVQILLNSSFAKLMAIQFHDRGNAEILTSPDNNNFLSLVFPIVGR